MAKDFQLAPVPVRLSCRYSNGVVVSYVARAVAFDDFGIKVLSAEGFEKDVQLSVLAPFIEGIVPCRVAAASRSRDHTGYFELLLKFLKKPKPAPQAKKAPPVEEGHFLIPENMARAALEFAAKLEQLDPWPISRVLQEIPAAERTLLLIVAAAATSLLLHEKGILDLRHVADGLQQKG